MQEKKKVSFRWAFREYIWPRKKIVSLGLFLIIVRSLSGLVLPYASKALIDEVIPSKNTTTLTYLLVAVGVSLLLQSLSSFSLTRLLSVEAQHLISVLRANVQKKLLTLPVSFFDNQKAGALVSRVMTDVEGVRNLVGTGLVQLFGGSITALISLVILININGMMTLFVLLPVGVFALIALKAFGYIRPIFRERGKINAEVTGRLTETLNGIRVIKGFNAEEQEQKTFEAGVERLFLNVKKSLTATAFMTSASTFLLGTASAGIMGIGGYFIMQGSLVLKRSFKMKKSHSVFIMNGKLNLIFLALVTSVVCTLPWVKFQINQLSTVPKANSPASARLRMLGSLSRIHLILVPEK